MKRRSFMSLTALAAAHGKLASDATTSIAGGDHLSLAAAQTTHGTDLVIASQLDRASTTKLRRWMRDGSEPVLRVNAAGILAKIPGQYESDTVIKMLSHDAEIRNLYLTAVTARVCGLEWEVAELLARNPRSMVRKAHFLAARFADEVTNPRDVGARWCSAVMLRDLSPLLGR
jgi:hypothetical protein